MTMILDTETEALLLKVAAQRGLPPDAALSAVLAEADADFADTVAALREAFADLEAGDRGMLLEDYRAEVEARRQARQSVA